MLFAGDEEVEPKKHRHPPGPKDLSVTKEYDGQHFFTL
ncbi:MAG: hypothetical protein CM1200mP29_17030 [Verrucomicrobiota bacterium]|nr:MAG: hypothetical protein CM1200mP29_17030 [Verrucomicrobiota bacterium]